MAELNFKIGGRPYTMACADGQEDALQKAAALLDSEAQGIQAGSGQLSEARLLLFSALIVADKYQALLNKSESAPISDAPAQDAMDDILSALRDLREQAEELAAQ